MSGDGCRIQVFLSGEDLGEQEIPAGTTTIGSASGCGLQLLGKGIAHVHVVASAVPGGAGLDVEQASPDVALRVNGHSLPSARMSPGDELEIGAYRIVVLDGHDDDEDEDEQETLQSGALNAAEWMAAAGLAATVDASPVHVVQVAEPPTVTEAPALRLPPEPDPSPEPDPAPEPDDLAETPVVLDPLPDEPGEPGQPDEPDEPSQPVRVDPGDVYAVETDPFWRPEDRWVFWRVVLGTAAAHLLFLGAAALLAPEQAPTRAEGLRRALADDRFVALMIQPPEEVVEAAGGKGGRGRGRKRRGGRRGRAGDGAGAGSGSRQRRASAAADGDGGGGDGRGGALHRLFAGARAGAGGAIDLSGGGGSPSGSGEAGGARDALGSSLPGGGGGAGGGGAAGFDGLVGKGKKGRRGSGRGGVGRALMSSKGSSVKGALTKGQVRKVIAKHHRKLRRCYVNRLQTRPGLAGRITIHFVIDKRGRVDRVSSFDGIGDAPLKQCVENRFRAMRFPKPRRGEVQVNWPLSFQAAE